MLATSPDISNYLMMEEKKAPKNVQYRNHQFSGVHMWYREAGEIRKRCIICGYYKPL